jgi:hypothetical protein
METSFMSEGNTNPLGSDAGSIDAAAAAFSGILGGGDEPIREEADTPVDAAEEAVEDEASGAEATAEEEYSEDGAEPADDDSDDGSTQTRKFTVKVDGTEIEVDESELVRGYQREADYTRKTQAVAEERRAIEAHKAEVAAERQRYAASVQQITQFLESTAPQPPSVELLDADPVEFLRQKTAYEEHAAQLHAWKSEQQQLTAKQQQESQRRFQAVVAQEHEKALAAIPAWKDPKTAESEKKALASYLVEKSGYSPQEVGSLADSRALVIARKAMLYDQMLAKRPEVERKVAEAPKFQKPGTQKSVKTQGQQRHEAKVNRLRQTGRVEDAAAVFRDFL